MKGHLQSRVLFHKFVNHQRSSSIKCHIQLEVVFHQSLSSIKGSPPSKFFFHHRLSFVNGIFQSNRWLIKWCLPPKGSLPSWVVFHQSSSSIKGYPLTVVFHQRSSFVKGYLPSLHALTKVFSHQRSSNFVFHQRATSIKDGFTSKFGDNLVRNSSDINDIEFLFLVVVVVGCVGF